MKTARDHISALVRKGWSAEKAKDIIARDLPIGSSKSEVCFYLESQLYPGIERPYLEMVISNPQHDQIIPAGPVFDIDFVNHTCADEVLTCMMSYPKVTGFVQVAFWFRDEKLTLVNIQNKGRIV
ncbi:hypothetical protein [Mesorhizobium amorphae]|uniref:Uncharacterized protein n=1 Tax=Mesorhizobium amorphae CCNWGS0123 TaxID=1082933 RepID=G6YHX4_9HYPH|nr:hypothetical protein [Mesorhizobium amorphae]ANT49165.1 hypothetical protein A6B35_04055 [Mesorhizobium amorphae CCNWGS0123]EHH07211.1 hypothetical protein MEA186_27970 [Mesorhizobium amorphae CCNWGS0123]GLR43082.1 hypothetical protein GCM10007880_35990 [Mesorhizobium amorphae]